MENRLRELRLQRGLALWGLTARSGVAASTLSAIERHGYEPSARTRARIATALGAAVEEIWPGQALEVPSQ